MSNCSSRIDPAEIDERDMIEDMRFGLECVNSVWNLVEAGENTESVDTPNLFSFQNVASTSAQSPIPNNSDDSGYLADASSTSPTTSNSTSGSTRRAPVRRVPVRRVPVRRTPVRRSPRTRQLTALRRVVSVERRLPRRSSRIRNRLNREREQALRNAATLPNTRK
ncbi:uncharacterized protein Dwil_GK26870 [Drosophila willistoni]|uniref:Uncharacterized protein n=1 Tax=Drosophila willistoni TaxID=7260 RepID=A0A0Q9X135_DROWI|nr:uncharacterized protein Dwil_GK26870 [Drosophila willistoni]